MGYIGYYNGAYLPQDKIYLSPHNLAFARGYGAFELLRTYQRKPFYLQEHIERFLFSIASLHLPKPQVDFIAIIQKLLFLNPLGELVFRFYCSEEEEKPLFLILTERVVPPTDTDYLQGISVITTSLARTLVAVKSTNYLAGQVALKQAAACGAVDALFLGHNEELLELTRSNFFCVMRGQLYTPKEGILCGITRKLILFCAQELNIPIIEGLLYKEMIPTFTEAFLTSTIKEVVPIRQIDQETIPLGPLTQRLRHHFHAKYTERNSSFNLCKK